MQNTAFPKYLIAQIHKFIFARLPLQRPDCEILEEKMHYSEVIKKSAYSDEAE